MSKSNKRTTSSGTEILRKRFLANDKELARMVDDHLVNLMIAQQIYDLRKEVGLTQKELADKIGTTSSVISRLEDADYNGHSLSMLKKIASALGRQLRIEFVELEKTSV